MLPSRLFELLSTCDATPSAYFPATEVFNETWMLRLLLDAIHRLAIAAHPFSALDDAIWYSEARLSSPFAKRSRLDNLAEGQTNSDAVIGHFAFSPLSTTGLRLLPAARQFVVVEAKMFSNLSTGTKHAQTYNQAARTVACMAFTLAQSGISLNKLERLGFFVIAPDKSHLSVRSNLEECLSVESIRTAIDQRIRGYEQELRPEAENLRKWEADSLSPFLKHLQSTGSVALLRWEDGIECVRTSDPAMGSALDEFYRGCLSFSPIKLRASAAGN